MDNRIRVTFDCYGYARLVDNDYSSEFVSKYFDSEEQAIQFCLDNNQAVRESLTP